MHQKIFIKKIINVKTVQIISSFGRFFHDSQAVSYPFYIGGRTNLNKIPQNHGFHCNSFVDDLIYNIQINGRNDCPLMRDNVDKPILLKPLKDAADRCSGYVIALAKTIFT